MTDFAVPHSTKTCSVSGRTLAAGEKCYAVLSEDDGKYVRRDFAAEAWNGPPPGTVAFWAGRVPASDRPRKPTFNEELLVDWFGHLAGRTEPDRVNFRYVVALLLMRRKRLKFEDATRAESGESVLWLRDAKSGARHAVPDPRLTGDEAAAVQDEVFRVLGWE